jgi:hypothetical protein
VTAQRPVLTRTGPDRLIYYNFYYRSSETALRLISEGPLTW